MSIGPAGQRDFGPIEGPSSDEAHGINDTSQSDATQEAVFPRSGWQDGEALGAAQLRAKLGLDQEQATGPANFRQALRDFIQNFEPPNPLREPEIMMMYGMAPWSGIDPSQTEPGQIEPEPAPPMPMPMYGMPPIDIDPQPAPEPLPMPMYGMPPIGPGGGEDPFDPGMIMLYGMPPRGEIPGGGGGTEPSPIDPGMIMLYGMPPRGTLDNIG